MGGIRSGAVGGDCDGESCSAPKSGKRLAANVDLTMTGGSKAPLATVVTCGATANNSKDSIADVNVTAGNSLKAPVSKAHRPSRNQKIPLGPESKVVGFQPVYGSTTGVCERGFRAVCGADDCVREWRFHCLGRRVGKLAIYTP